MAETPTRAPRLARNIVHFARALRKAGLPVGPDQVIDAMRAVELAGIGSREDFYWTLHAVFVTAHEQRPLFDQAFHLFWRRRALVDEMMAMMLPEIRAPGRDQTPRAGARRMSDALAGARPEPETRIEPESLVDATLTFSEREVLRKKDFEQMTAQETATAKRALARLALPLAELKTRRFRPGPPGTKVELRATLRAALRSGGEPIRLFGKRRRRRLPPLVIICDISGSMESYSRILLHFLHGATRARGRVASFVFGTRLTNITRRLRHRDVDEAVARICEDVEDWSGGTRIGHCLKAFNKDWARRVLGQGAHVILITDGLDRGDIALLEAETARLHRSCRRLIWLNPLLRFEGFEAKAQGVRAMLAHVDEFRAAHNLESLEALVDALCEPRFAVAGPRGWLKAA